MKLSKIAQKITLFISLSGLMFGCNNAQNTEKKQVTILGVIIGEQQEKLEKALAPFEERTGIEVVYEGTDAFATLLPIRVDSGNAPDIAMFPQPGLMADFARENKLIPLDTFITKEKLQEAYSPDWLKLGTIDNNIYGLWYRV